MEYADSLPECEKHNNRAWLNSAVAGALRAVANDHPDWQLGGYRFESIRARIAGALADAIGRRVKKLVDRQVYAIRKRVEELELTLNTQNREKKYDRDRSQESIETSAQETNESKAQAAESDSL